MIADMLGLPDMADMKSRDQGRCIRGPLHGHFVSRTGRYRWKDYPAGEAE